VKVTLILPALTEATSPWWRPIKYSLFPPLGLATLAAYLDEGDEAEIQDEHVERLSLEDAPDLVVIQVYITSISCRTQSSSRAAARTSATSVTRSDFYRWKSIARGAATHGTVMSGLRHFAYAAGWKKFEPLWDVVIRAKRGRHDAAGAGDHPQRVRATLLPAATDNTPTTERVTSFPTSPRGAMSPQFAPAPCAAACPPTCRESSP